ncbi:MAG TPA: homoserine O-succinyltransferase, partial [Opitutaceae bacterium]|nr:homoserine O-succinyltransferase [Opitutaceae bacterium]
MPLVAHNALPTFERLRQDGITVLSTERAANQEIRELHVGLLNMMPDAALEATERQFYRLVGESNPIAQFYMHPFTLPTLPRGETAQAHIAQFYESFEAIRAAGLDALIITGANVSHPNLADESFWQPLIEVIDWAWDNVTSTLCSCLATHAVMQFRHGQARVKQPQKIWGVFEHRVTDGRLSSSGVRL